MFLFCSLYYYPAVYAYVFQVDSFVQGFFLPKNAWIFLLLHLGQWRFWRPERVITMATPHRNYELQKSYNYVLNSLIFGS